METIFAIIQLAISLLAFGWSACTTVRLLVSGYDLFYVVAMAAMTALTLALAALSAGELKGGDQ